MRFFIAVIVIFLSSCGDSVYDKMGNLICKDQKDCGKFIPDELSVPASNEKFSNILSNSKLHYPDSQTDVDYDDFDGFVTNYFYLDDSYLTFQLDKHEYGKYRSELRQGPQEWDVSDERAHIIKARVKCYGSEELSKYTFLQIHGDDPFSLPLLRMVWEKRHESKTNHLWAVIMISRDLEEKRYEWIDLGERKSSFIDMEVIVQSNKMYIDIDGKTIQRDVSYWYDIDNYYKVGLYLSDKKSKGITKLQFDSLEYIVR